MSGQTGPTLSYKRANYMTIHCIDDRAEKTGDLLIIWHHGCVVVVFGSRAFRIGD
jgi:hypothetical protein